MLSIGYLILAIALVSSVSFAMTSIRRARNERQFNQSRLQLIEQKIQHIIAQKQNQTDLEKAAWQGFRKFKIDKIVQLSDDIKSFYLKPIDKLALPTYQPGQYLTLSLKLPNKDKPLVRCYSLSNSPDTLESYRVSIKRIAATDNTPEGLISNYMHEQAQTDEVIDAKMPSGHFYYDTAAPHPAVLVGGGIGITPVYSMFCAIAALANPPETWFFYGVRSQEEEVFVDSLQALAAKHDQLNVIVCHSTQTQTTNPRDNLLEYNERISVDLFKRVLPSSNYQYYICGPALMMQQLTQDLLAWAVPEQDIHFEAFGPASVKSNQEVTASNTVDAFIQYDIIFTHSDKKRQWNNAKGSLLEFIESENIPIESSCRAGNCGSCVVDLNAGKVKYDKPPGAALGKNQCLACIAKPDSNLIIDA